MAAVGRCYGLAKELQKCHYRWQIRIISSIFLATKPQNLLWVMTMDCSIIELRMYLFVGDIGILNFLFIVFQNKLDILIVYLFIVNNQVWWIASQLTRT